MSGFLLLITEIYPTTNLAKQFFNRKKTKFVCIFARLFPVKSKQKMNHQLHLLMTITTIMAIILGEETKMVAAPNKDKGDYAHEHYKIQVAFNQTQK
jgi:hypothetical protein